MYVLSPVDTVDPNAAPGFLVPRDIREGKGRGGKRNATRFSGKPNEQSATKPTLSRILLLVYQTPRIFHSLIPRICSGSNMRSRALEQPPSAGPLRKENTSYSQSNDQDDGQNSKRTEERKEKKIESGSTVYQEKDVPTESS
jgi:hypothetical protein